MSTFFGVPTERLALGALSVLLVILGGLAVRAWRWPVFLRLGLRQLPRRPQQTALIAAGLMLSTALVTASLSTGDTITHAIRAAAVQEIGRLDEVITYSSAARLPAPATPGGGGASGGGAAGDAPFATTSFFPLATYERLEQRLSERPEVAQDIAGITPAIWLSCTMIDVTSRQTAPVQVRALPPNYARVFGELVDPARQKLSLAVLQPGEAYLNDAAGGALGAQAGDELSCTVAGVPQRWRAAGVTAPAGLGAGAGPSIFVPLHQLQSALGVVATGGVPDSINQVWIANRGDEISGADRSERVLSAIRPLLVDAGALEEVAVLLRRADLRAALAVRRGSLPERTQAALAELLTLADEGATGRLERPLSRSSVRFALLAAARDVPEQSLLQTLEGVLQRATGYQVLPVKQQILEIADRAGNVITTIFLLFSLLSITSGLLLIFLIFSLLAAARRSELGVSRALGVERGHLIAMFTFEGVAYALLAVLVGLPAGLAISRLLVALLVRAVESGVTGFSGAAARVAETVVWRVEPRSAALAASLGMLLTVATVAISAWRVSRVTIVTAIRDLPEPPPVRPGRSAWWWVALLPLGLALMLLGLRAGQTFPFAAGTSCLVLLVGALVREAAGRWWGREVGRRVAATITGAGLAGYWALPFDAQQQIGLPRLASGIEIFALAGVLMVAGTVWALTANGDLLLAAITHPLTALGRPAPALRLAAAHSLRNPFRTGLTTTMFALVIFMLTVMQVVTAAAMRFHSNAAIAYGGWHVQAQTTAAVATPGPAATAALEPAPGPVSAPEPPPTASLSPAELAAAATARPELNNLIAAAGVRTSTFFPLIQLSAPSPSWAGYPVAAVDQGFAMANEIPLQTRARSYATDRQVWEAVARGENLAIIDGNALPAPELRGQSSASPFSFTLYGVHDEQPLMDPVPLWIGNPTGGAATKVTVIGVVDRRSATAFRGLHVAPGVLQGLGTPIRPPAVRFYFRLFPSADLNQTRAALGATFFEEGLQTTNLIERFANESGPLLLSSQMLQLFVSLGLFVGVAALGVISTRAALERRQEIGILRAIGYTRIQVGSSLLIEAALVMLLGSAIGVSLGLVLCRNVFSVQFFDRFQQGMRLVIPWEQLSSTVAITCLAAVLATWLPARHASRIPPIAALRDE